MRHIISVLLQNEAGALARVSGLFSARGYNIESVSVAPTEDPERSRLTLVTLGTDAVIDQICRQLEKLIDVVAVADITRADHIERELLLVKVLAEGSQRDAVKQVVANYHARLVDDTETTYTVELTAATEEIEIFINELGGHAQIIETVRSGVAGIGKGAKPLDL